MPIWPFNKRRRSAVRDDGKQPLTEKSQPIEQRPTNTATDPLPGSTQPVAIPRRSSKGGSRRKRRASQDEKAAEASSAGHEKQPIPPGKENVPSAGQRRGRSSQEDITALPMSRELESSPHLRAVDMERPHIPYNFRQYSTSQTSVQREEPLSTLHRPNTLRSRRSGYDSTTPSRRQSSKRRKDDPIREEEIRMMSAQGPIPKRPGEGPLKRDSKKMRGSLKGSYVDLPGEEDVHSTMSGISEQRGWEIGSIDVFNPRPAVRLSGTPQHMTAGSLPTSPPMSPTSPWKQKEKMSASRDGTRKRETIGARADDFDASDLRMMLERDAKRREKRKKEQQEKLDKKLRNRAGRNRGDSDKRRREVEEASRVEESRKRADEERRRVDAQERRARAVVTTSTAIHLTLRDAPLEQQAETSRLDTAERQAEPGASEIDERFLTPGEQPEDPFTDAAAEPEVTPTTERGPVFSGGFSPVQTPMEEPILETAREVRLSQAATPPLSPVQPTGATSSLSQMIVDQRRTSELAPPPPIRDPDQRRRSDPKPERRVGPWATFFRRGGNNLRKPEESTSPTSESGFSNVSRQHMRFRPLPPHLVDTQAEYPRSKFGTPVRTQSKFREDLPEMPISPPDSRLPSPDMISPAAAAFAARRTRRGSGPVDIPEDTVMEESDPSGSMRNDTPISPSVRSQRMTSLASIDSEGSWLASGAGQRHSTQSGVTRSIGSLNQRQFTGSYEELGGDKDAEYFQRLTPSPDTKRALYGAKLSSSPLAGPAPDEESEEEGESGQPETPGDPLTVHESVRRKPTLVHRDARVRSREGLLAEFADVEEPAPTSAGTGRGSLDFDSDEPEPIVQRATSVNYSQKHARQWSSGSATLLDVPPRSPRDVSPTPT
ncbi:hypothetical protein LTR37_003324 [Vermiconidia calcicola]|uniref:Uncharacterized protein n=1 Tax=Vermiconidia calcicola TaxID=1690605 RepID=A0ACC3NSQ6_9PEZI|nr:hypothetical protein LTR37_003324 [Vermiconidia calcicola]